MSAAPDKIVKIMPLAALTTSIIRAMAPMGRYPARIVACPMQIRKWTDQMGVYERMHGRCLDPSVLTIMGIPVSAGADDATAELVWAVPITEDAPA